MSIGNRIKEERNKKKLSTNDLSKLTKIPQSTISKLENGKRKADIETLEKIAEALNVSVHKLTGESASAIIEARLKEKGMTLEDIAVKTNNAPSLYWLQNLDNYIPGEWVSKDREDIGYLWITNVAKVLDLPSSVLRAALARQEIPTYDGPTETVEEAFGNVDFNEYLPPTNAELQELLETFHKRPEMKTLFSVTKNATKEDIEKAVKIIEALKNE